MCCINRKRKEHTGQRVPYRKHGRQRGKGCMRRPPSGLRSLPQHLPPRGCIDFKRVSASPGAVGLAGRAGHPSQPSALNPSASGTTGEAFQNEARCMAAGLPLCCAVPCGATPRSAADGGVHGRVDLHANLGSRHLVVVALALHRRQLVGVFLQVAGREGGQLTDWQATHEWQAAHRCRKHDGRAGPGHVSKGHRPECCRPHSCNPLPRMRTQRRHPGQAVRPRAPLLNPLARAHASRPSAPRESAPSRGPPLSARSPGPPAAPRARRLRPGLSP